jgi:hypothetical protein
MRGQNRRLLVALLLYFLGVGVYLAQSSAPWRVHVVTIPLQFLLLMTTSILTWWQGLRRSSRVLSFMLLIVLGSLTWIYFLSKVVMAIYPLDPATFIKAGLALMVECLLFALVTWAVDSGLRSAMERTKSPARPGDKRGKT